MKNNSPFPEILLIIGLILSIVFLFSPVAATESLITLDTVGSSQGQPVIAGDWIVWVDGRDGDSAIFAYNLATGIEQRLTPAPASAYNPAISGNRVVFHKYDGDNYNIWLYDLGSGTETPITSDPKDQTTPVIGGDLIAWQDNQNGTWDIYVYDISSETATLLTPDTVDSDQINPSVSGNLVAWQDYRFFNEDWGSSFYDIYLYDTSSAITYNISPETPDSDQQFPAIAGTRIVWQDDRNTQYGDIYLNDTSTWESFAVNEAAGSFKILPAISGDSVAWLDSRDRGGGADYDVYRKDLSSGPDRRVTDDAAWVLPDRGPEISGNRIVWTDFRNGDDDIFLASTDSDLSCPVADFTISPGQSGPAPLTVQFEDITPTGAGIIPVSHWDWSFGDGSASDIRNPGYTYTSPGNYNVRLTVDNPYCRNMTPLQNAYTVNVGGAPVASFIAQPTSGIVPLEVTLTDTSVGATSWDWSFSDGSTSGDQNPVHVYTTAGTYTIALTASNDYGSSYANTTIHALTGAQVNSVTEIPGITVENRHGRQFLTYDGSVLPGYALPDSFMLISPPLQDYGWQNITFLTGDPAGFSADGSGTITGNLTGVIFNVVDIVPGSFSESTGTMSSINYSATFSSYPDDAAMDTRIWEDSTPDDLAAFSLIIHSSNFAYIHGVAYTIKVSRDKFPQAESARFIVSVNSTWVEEHGGRAHTFLIRLSDDRSNGEVLGTTFLYADENNNLDFFSADSPRGLSTFGLAQLSGSGNLFQLVTLSVAEESASDGKSPAIPATQEVTVSPSATIVPEATPTQAGSVFPAVNATLYSNPHGVITQRTELTSSDNHAIVAVERGITALDRDGNPLSAITVAPADLADMEGSSADTSFRYTGFGYSLGPDGSTFSPSVNLTLMATGQGWNSEYMIREYDAKAHAWIDLPTEVHPDSGAISTHMSRFCSVGLFSRPVASPVTLAAKAPSVTATIAASTPPPSSAVDIFINMLVWLKDVIMQNFLIFAIIMIAVVLLWLIGRKRRMDRIRYLL